MQTHPNSTPDSRYRDVTQQRLSGLTQAHPDRLIWWVWKIMGTNASWQVWMVGWIRDIWNPDHVWQASDETWRAHASDSNYADYSQMVQMRHIDFISAAGELTQA
jgi:hypothetical protein